MKKKEKDKKDVGRRDFLKLGVAAGVGAAGFLSGPGIPFVHAQAKETLKIGNQSIMSGPLAGYGEYMVRGCEIAKDMINAEGGVLGHKIEVKYRDDELNPAVGVKNARYLVDDWGAHFLTGVDSSPVAKAIGNTLPELKRIFIVTHASTQDIHEDLVFKKGIKYLFRTGQPFYQDSYYGAIVAATKVGGKRWAMVGPDEEYGYKNWEMFQALMKKYVPDAEFVAYTWVPYGTTDFTPHLSKVMAAKPDGIFSTEWGGELVSCIKQAKRMGVFEKIKAWLTGMGAGMDVLEGLGKDYPTKCWASCRYYFEYPPTKFNYEFVKEFVKRFNHYPHYSAELNVAAFYLIKYGCERAGTITDVDKIVKGMEGLTYMTPAGARWIRPEDHACVYEVPWGRIMHDPRYPMPILTDLTSVTWPFYWAGPPPEYAVPPGPGEKPTIPYVPYKK